MFKNTYQKGLLSIFYSCGSNPLAIWESEVNNGHIKRLTDSEVNSIVLEIVSTNVTTTYISCPKNNQVLGITLPFLILIVKNLKRYFTFEITVLDDKNLRRRFRISNFQSTTKILPFCTTMPIGLSGGWNQIQFNLADFTRRAYGTQFIETLRVQVHANARLRRIYFSDRLYTEEELPQDYKLYLPFEKKQKKGKVEKEEKDEKEDKKGAKAAKTAAPPPEEVPPPAEPGPELVEPKEEPVSTPVEIKTEPAETPEAGEAAEATPAESEAPPEESGAEGAGDEAPAETPEPPPEAPAESEEPAPPAE